MQSPRQTPLELLALLLLFDPEVLTMIKLVAFPVLGDPPRNRPTARAIFRA
jgi:hypothetical protein